MTKITPEHLARTGIVYVRQSSPHQVANNLESQRRQYALVARGQQLGWSDVQVIDDDLGRSGNGISRPGFERLLPRICEGRVGAVLSIEASRLARNGRDWHTLLEFCGLVGTLIIDEDGIYDPRQPNDRLLLGMKGTMSEMELSIFRQRSAEATVGSRRPNAGNSSRGGRLLEDRRRPDREGSRSPSAGRHRSCVPQVHGTAECPTSARLDKAGADPVACRGSQGGQAINRLEDACVPHDPSHLDKPSLLRRLRLRPAGCVGDDRERTQADLSLRTPQLEGLGRVDQGSPRGVYFVGRISKESVA